MSTSSGPVYKYSSRTSL